MGLDPDSAAVMAMLTALRPPPTADTDAAAYRAATVGMAPPPSTVAVGRVEDVTVAGPGGPIRLRLYADRQDAPAPAMLFLHGGGFVGGGIETHDDLCRRLVRATGRLVVSVDYRLAPEHRCPAALDDAGAALDWAAGPAGASYGIDPDRIMVVGDSAGGNIAAALAIAARDRGGPALTGQLLLYPMIDPACAGASHVENATGRFLTAEACRWYWDRYAGPDADRCDPRLAPMCGDLTGLPPAAIVTAGHDPLRDDGAGYAAALRAAGVPVDYRCLDGTFHGFLGFPDLSASVAAMAWIAAAVAGLGPASARERSMIR